MAKVALENVSKNFGSVEAVKNFNLTVEDKEFAILVGPSGCGKSTALRMVAGLEEPTIGTISIGTNTFDPHYDYHLSCGHYAIFDAVFASNKIGLSKPDPKFYRYILKNEAVDPQDAFFVDDMVENVLSAESIGINAILFRDFKSLGLQIKNHQRSTGAFAP